MKTKIEAGDHHVRHQCGPNTKRCTNACMIPDGAGSFVQWCESCGGHAPSLPTHCPKVRMTGFQEVAIKDGLLDFIDGAWRDVGGVTPTDADVRATT